MLKKFLLKIFSKNEIHMAQLHVMLFRTKKFFQIRPSILEKSRGQKRAFLPHFHNAVTRQWTDGFR